MADRSAACPGAPSRSPRLSRPLPAVRPSSCSPVSRRRRRDHQVIVATGLSNQAPDQQYLKPLFARTLDNLDEVPSTFTADAGSTQTTTQELCEKPAARHISLLNENDEPGPLPNRSRAPPKDADEKTLMQHGLKTEEGMERIRRRKITVEPVFGTIKEAMGSRRFLLRGMHKVRAEWALVWIAFDIRKLHAAKA